MEIEFSWDEHKADTNLKKHGVAFEDATLVFYDAYAVFKQDRFENGEYRLASDRSRTRPDSCISGSYCTRS